MRTYKEAKEKALTVKWKTTVCAQGRKCWCRIIEPVNKIIYDEIEEYYVVGSGSIPKEEAEYLVKLHNEKLMK